MKSRAVEFQKILAALALCYCLTPRVVEAYEPFALIKSKAGYQCRVYKDSVMRFSSFISRDTPDGMKGMKIEVLSKAEDIGNAQTCERGKAKTVIEDGGLEFLGLSSNLIFTGTLEGAPGSTPVIVFDSITGKKVANLETYDLPYAVTGTKITYYAFRKTLENQQCPKSETVGFGCTLVEKAELDIRTGQRRWLGNKQYVCIQ